MFGGGTQKKELSSWIACWCPHAPCEYVQLESGLVNASRLGRIYRLASRCADVPWTKRRVKAKVTFFNLTAKLATKPSGIIVHLVRTYRHNPEAENLP